MKIAIMMRAIDQDSAYRATIEGLVGNMLRIDSENTYLLLYRTSKWFGLFSSFPNAKEVLLWAPHKLLWDQVAVPYRAWRERADIIFNSKFSIPFISHCPVAMGLHEPAWWAWPHHYERFDAWYMRTMLPLYCRKSSHMFAISKFVIDESRRYMRLPFDNTTVVYHAPNKQFRRIDDAAMLDEFRNRYSLPQRFILAVTRVDHPGLDSSTSFHPGKNVETTVRAFALCRNEVPHRLVVAGRRVREYLLHTGLSDGELEGVHFTGFVPHEELPKLFNLADLFVIPSFYEGFGLVAAEAMACGCPVVASQSGACPEVAGDAALLANPYDPADFARKMVLALTNENLRQELRVKSLVQASRFSWERSAKLVLEGLTRVVAGQSRQDSSL